MAGSGYDHYHHAHPPYGEHHHYYGGGATPHFGGGYDAGPTVPRGSRRGSTGRAYPGSPSGYYGPNVPYDGGYGSWPSISWYEGAGPTA